MRKHRFRYLFLLLLAENATSFLAGVTRQQPVFLPSLSDQHFCPPSRVLVPSKTTPSIQRIASHDHSYIKPSTGPAALRRSSTLLQSSASENSSDTRRSLDKILSRLTLGFPFYVMLAALSGIYRPSLLEWVNRGNLISLLLASVMWGTGLSLQAEDFRKIPPKTVVFGVACQFMIMPLSAWMVANLWLKDYSDLFLGLCLVGCAPGK
jgi:Sodium Bile acid symporter family